MNHAIIIPNLKVLFKRCVCLSLFLIFSVGTVSGKKILITTGKDKQPHLVTGVSSKSFSYGPTNKEKVYIDQAPTSFTNYPYYVPGMIFMEKKKLTMVTYTSNGGGLSDSFEAQIELEIKPNRDVPDAYLVVNWRKSESDQLKLVCPIGNLKAGKTKKLEYFLPVHKSYTNTRYRLHFMTGGVEMVSSTVETTSADLSPFEEYQKKQGSDLEDGPALPFYQVLPKHLMFRRIYERNSERTEGNQSNTIRVIATIDEYGYVTDFKFEEKKVSDPLLAEYAMETIQLWKFKPRIKDGKAVESQVTIPFVFDAGKFK